MQLNSYFHSLLPTPCTYNKLSCQKSFSWSGIYFCETLTLFKSSIGLFAPMSMNRAGKKKSEYGWLLSWNSWCGNLMLPVNQNTFWSSHFPTSLVNISYPLIPQIPKPSSTIFPLSCWLSEDGFHNRPWSDLTTRSHFFTHIFCLPPVVIDELFHLYLRTASLFGGWSLLFLPSQGHARSNSLLLLLY